MSSGSQDAYAASYGSLQRGRYGMVVACSLQYYDWLLLMGDELEYIHFRPGWGALKVAYLLCRYYPLVVWPFFTWAVVGDHDAALCIRIVAPMQAMYLPLQCLSQFVMLFRAWAFTGRSRRVFWILAFFFTALVAVDMWTFLSHIPLASAEARAKLGKTACYVDYEAAIMVTRMSVIILAATMMDTASLLVILHYFVKRQVGGSSLTRTFIREGMITYTAVVVTNAIAAAVYLKPGQPREGTTFPIMFATSTVFACRIIIHLRKQMRETSLSFYETVDAHMANRWNSPGRSDWEQQELSFRAADRQTKGSEWMTEGDVGESGVYTVSEQTRTRG